MLMPHCTATLAPSIAACRPTTLTPRAASSSCLASANGARSGNRSITLVHSVISPSPKASSESNSAAASSRRPFRPWSLMSHAPFSMCCSNVSQPYTGGESGGHSSRSIPNKRFSIITYNTKDLTSVNNRCGTCYRYRFWFFGIAVRIILKVGWAPLVMQVKQTDGKYLRISRGMQCA